jgi:hypothetical protein
MSLDEFKTRAEKVLGTYGEFLSHCDGDKQTCR